MATMKYCYNRRKLKIYPNKLKDKSYKRAELCRGKYWTSSDLLKEHNFFWFLKIPTASETNMCNGGKTSIYPLLK